MDKFEEAICGHNPLYKEGLQDKYYQGAKWAWQSRQAEVDELNQLYLKAQHQEIRHRTIAQDALALVEEKDKRIEQLQAKVDAVEHVLGCAMIAPKEVFQYADRIVKALRGEHE